jgi:hypothetical protein
MERKQVHARVEEARVVTVKIVVEEDDDVAAAECGDLFFNRAERSRFVAVALRGERAERAAEVAVAAGFGVADAVHVRDEIKAWSHFVGAVGGAESVADDVLHLFDVAGAAVVEVFFRELRKRADHGTSGDDDDARIFCARVGGEMQHAIEGGVEAGEDQHVGPAEQHFVEERALAEFVVQMDIAGFARERSGQVCRRHAERDLVAPRDGQAQFVEVGVHDQDFFRRLEHRINPPFH